MKDEVLEYREKLVEAVADYDETLMEKFFEDPDSITEEEINAALEKLLSIFYHPNDLWFFFQKQRSTVYA
jgi:translation elongation factor EF-G